MRASCIFLNDQLGEYLFQFTASCEADLARHIIQYLRTWLNVLEDEADDIAHTVGAKHFIEGCEGFMRLDFASSEVGFVTGFLVYADCASRDSGTFPA